MVAFTTLLSRSVFLAVLAGLQAHAGNDVPGQEPGTRPMAPVSVSFPVSCSPAVQPDFDRAMTLFHSSRHARSIQHFRELARTYPGCGMAYWGIALNIVHDPAGGPASAEAWDEGRFAVNRALSVSRGTERDYVSALEAFYRDADRRDLRARQVAYERAMEQMHLRYPDDVEAVILHALALNMTALPADRTFFNRLRTAVTLERAFAKQPGHPLAAQYLSRGCLGMDPLD